LVVTIIEAPTNAGCEKERTREGSLLEFDHVFSEFERPVYNYLLHLTQNQADAEDLTQETFIRVHDRLKAFRGEASLRTWVYRIATNLSIDYFRSSAHHQTNASLSLEEVDLERELVDLHTPSATQQVEQAAMSDCMQKFVQDLPFPYQMVLILHDFQGLTNQEIADVLKISLDTVKIRLHRARLKLRLSLRANCDLYHDERNVLVCQPSTADKAQLE
jgi:RNA polymerase sigma-70 factor, ECF subfamily